MQSSSSYQSLKTEPAFVSNQKYIRSRQHSSSVQKNLSDCCYSISNLALIIACVIAILYLVKFLQDDVLYDLGEYILSLRFYRQLIYVIVVVPLTLIVPLFNAASAFIQYGKDKRELCTSLLRVKIFYELLMAILIFVALVFISPGIRFTNMATQIELELRRHMKMRYENPFSFELLDRIQEEFQCCDEQWYRHNFMDKLPATCYAPDGTYSTIYGATCSVVLGSLVSYWCGVIAACLVVILVALAVLLGIDILELLTYSSGQYDVVAREAHLSSHGSSSSLNGNASGRNAAPRSSGGSKSSNDSDHDDDDEGDHENELLSSDIATRLRLGEREREQLPASLRQTKEKQLDFSREPQEPERGTWQDPYNVVGQQIQAQHQRVSPVLTRAQYFHNRTRSPVFVDADSHSREQHHESNTSLKSQGSSTTEARQPTKSALKKTSSFQRIDSDNINNEDDGISIQEHQRQLQRDLQSRRSLLNVRFAD